MGGIPLDPLACLASGAVEMRWASFKGRLSSGETVARPCQNQHRTEKRLKGGKKSKEPMMVDSEDEVEGVPMTWL